MKPHGHRGLIAAAAVILGLATVPTTHAQNARETTTAPLLMPVVDSRTQTIPGRYIVVFGDGIAGVGDDAVRAPARVRAAIAWSEKAEAIAQIEGTLRRRYRAALIGFSAELPPGALAKIRAMPGVSWIEANWTTRPAAPRTTPLAGTAAMGVVAPTSPGLDRIDQRNLALDDSFDVPQTSRGVHVYVIDSGIRPVSEEFANRVASAPADGFSAIADENGTNDCYGHGTEVASVIGGAKLGVARDVTLHPVRVFGCSNSTMRDYLIAGVDWVAQHYANAHGSFPALANMSLETQSLGSTTDALFIAVRNSVNLGITYVVAAGNGNEDACVVAPALVPDAITVANSSPDNDGRMLESSYGNCIDLFAPGDGIYVRKMNGTMGSEQGTSFSAAHVSGVAALFLGTEPDAKPSRVWRALCEAADVFGATPRWPGIKGNLFGSPNILLQWGTGAGGGKLIDGHCVNPAAKPLPRGAP